jgi:hypothetical protein
MEEISRIAKTYYQTCIDLKLFGCKGFGLVLLGCPFIFLTVWIAFKFSQQRHEHDAWIILPQFVGLYLWLEAKKLYDQNLIKRLQLLTSDFNESLKIQKTLYLSSLTSKIGKSLFEVLKNIEELQKINNKSRNFSPDNLGYYFSGFIYDPDSKNRILSLSVYLISLFALLTVAKFDNPEYIYSLIDQITLTEVMGFLGWAFFFIVFFYLIFMLPIMMAFGYIISPVMRAFSNQKFLVSYLISELTKFAFSEQQPNSPSKIR